MGEKIKFIDLFAGIGGFHYAAKENNGECVFASEIDKNAIETYRKNHGISPDNDITKVKTEDIPEFDLLCAGFPCQSFSKAGSRLGFEDKVKGTLFFDIARILKHHKPKYIILENVKNIISHDNGNTWNVIRETLKELGYRITKEPLLLSPHQFGIPQLRERVIIPGVYDPKNVEEELEISFESKKEKDENDIRDIIGKDEEDLERYKITEKEEKILEIWDEFYRNVKSETMGFPIWVDVFLEEIKTEESTPKWKKSFIKKNLDLYNKNKKFIDGWLKKHKNLEGYHKGFRKFEWQAGKSINSVFEGLIQFRPSGVRVKKPTVAPTLVAMVQTPIYGPERRKITLKEAARLQSFPTTFKFDENENQAYKQLGNSVNVKVISKVIEKMINTY